MKGKAIFFAGFLMALAPVFANAKPHRTCGQLLNPATQTYEHKCLVNPPQDGSFIVDANQPGQGGHSVWQGQTPSTPQPGQAANQKSAPLPSGGDTRHRVCERVYSQQFKEYTEKCHMESGPGVNQNAANSGQVINQTAPQTAPAPTQQNTQGITNIINGITGLFHKK